MRGALVGDCAGSFWENSYNKFVMPQWWVPACHFTDDSICTIATMKWLMEKDHSVKAYGKILREVCASHLDRGFASKFRAWVKDPHAPAYGSWGNGSVMRVSPVALWAVDTGEAMALAAQSAMPTHNSPEAIWGAQATAWALWHTLRGTSPQEVLSEVESRFDYPVLGLDPDEQREGHIFDVSCKGTVPLALAIGLKAHSFDQGLDWCYSMGGDADTLGAVAGPFLEARFGIPEQHWANTSNRFHDHPELFGCVEEFYKTVGEKHPEILARLNDWQDPTGPYINRKKYKIFSTDVDTL